MKYILPILAFSFMIASCGAGHDETKETKIEKTEVLNELDELDALDKPTKEAAKKLGEDAQKHDHDHDHNHEH